MFNTFYTIYTRYIVIRWRGKLKKKKNLITYRYLFRTLCLLQLYTSCQNWIQLIKRICIKKKNKIFNKHTWIIENKRYFRFFCSASHFKFWTEHGIVLVLQWCVCFIFLILAPDSSARRILQSSIVSGNESHQLQSILQRGDFSIFL